MKGPQERWLPRAVVARPDAASSARGERILARSVDFGVPVQISASDWETLASDLDVRTEAAARNILLLEARPPRHVRPEAFEHVVSRDQHLFGTQGFNCPYRCEYCYLYANSTFVRPVVTYTDLESILAEVTATIRHHPRKLTFNFGEDGDSLAIEHLTGSAAELITFFAKTDCRLELRSKAGLVPELLPLEHQAKTVIAASLMPPRYSVRYEHRAAAVHDRLRALRAYGHAGYAVALKLEPGLLLLDWEKEYSELLDLAAILLGPFVPDHISLGCFRYRQELAQAIRKNFPTNTLPLAAREEYIPNMYSYSFEQRRIFYEHLIAKINTVWPSVKIYLSMESASMCDRLAATPWRSVFDAERFSVATFA